MDRRKLLKAAAAGLAAAGPLAQAMGDVNAGIPERGFTSGVASGDPSAQGFVAWTRYVAPGGGAELRLEVAEDAGFRRCVARGSTRASPLSDYCAHAPVDGLTPGRWYYFRFVAPDGEHSPPGRSRTLPAGPAERFRIGVVCCSNATSGWFNSYAHLSARDDIDLVVHLGDYIYESPVARQDAVPGLAQARGIEPAHEAVSLADYRMRYRSYRADADLAALHARVPFVVMPDDHEVANNAWQTGAEGHHPATHGSWAARRDAALQAFREWHPARSGAYRCFEIGSLASLLRLDTRLAGRVRQVPLPDLAALLEGPWKTIDDFRAAIAQPDRTLLGAGQEAWLARELQRSSAAGVRWQVVAQQVVMGPRRFPLSAPGWLSDVNLMPAGDSERVRATLRLAALAGFGSLGLPFATDAWDGYPAARERLYRAAQDADAELVVLSGDSHNAWAFDLEHDGRPVAVEMSAPAVSSSGFDRLLAGDFGRVEADFVAANRELVWCDLSRRGYLELTLTPERVDGRWNFLPGGSVRTSAVEATRAWVCERGSHRLAAH